MADTHIAVHEYGHTTKSYVIRGGVTVTNSVWNDCVDAVCTAGFKPQQFPQQTIRKPGHWSTPANNLGNAACSQAYTNGVMANPHVHGGAGSTHRAAIGYRMTPADNEVGETYQFMKIYIGQFS